MSELSEEMKQAQIDLRERGIQPLVGPNVASIPLPARSDLSDWIDLMEVVDALCPKWPAPPAEHYGPFKLYSP